MSFEFPYITKRQKSGIISLILVILLLQMVLFYLKRTKTDVAFEYVVNKEQQKEIDSLKAMALKGYEIRKFNPNFISDYNASKFGMSVNEIDKLLEFRKEGKYVNSATEFQKVTGVSDSVLNKMERYFQFPEWTQHKEVQRKEIAVVKKIDLNTATFEQLVAINGIGDYFANLILTERAKMDGFVSIHQINFIKGMRPDAVNALKQNTFVKVTKRIEKVNVNTASKEQLAKVPYVSSYLAREIVILRSKQENPLKIEDLQKINNFPLDKLEIIKLYLDF